MNKKIIKILFGLFLFWMIPMLSSADSLPSFPKMFLYNLLDVQQQKYIHISSEEKQLLVCIFLSPECPLCQNYTKILNELQQKFKMKITILGIVPGSAYSIKDLNDFKNKYQISFKLLIDTKEKFTKYLGATVTPQAILLSNKGTLLYTGAIDNWVQALGKKKLQVTQHYLQDAIGQSVKNESVFISKATAFGCKINDY